MQLFFSILTVVLSFYILILIVVRVIHTQIFGKRFELNPLINSFTEDQFGCESEKLDFKIGELNISGKLVYPKDKNYNPNKIIIFCHGFNSAKESYMQDTAYIASRGFLTYCFDYIGTNESDGKSIGGFAQGVKSVDYAIKFIHNKYPEKDIYLYGHSWGGFNVINATRYNPCVKKICALSPFVNINTVISALFSSIYKPIVFNTALIEWFKTGKYALAHSLRSLNKYKGKALFIHSKNDNIVKYGQGTYQIYSKFKNNPNFKYIINDGRFHNPHYSDESVAKFVAFQTKLNSLKPEEQEAYMKTINFQELGQLDLALMDKIVDFFNEE